MNNVYHSFSLEDLENKNLHLFSAVSGSRAYGLATENSDTDIKGVFFLPYFDFLVSNPLKQVNDEKNNIVFYELGRFIELLLLNNPNILSKFQNVPCNHHKYNRLK
ncbi:MAG: nucleotidyltransferase domain-containing protein [Neisseriaceae bacterium]|nr:nucleotidyltransferase domain-containing protein [Neisseriaceae bacterium]